MTKEKILNKIERALNLKINAIQEEISSIEREMSEETKSSAGDKFETSREMMNQSINRLEERLHQQKEQLQQLKAIENRHQSKKIGKGSLVYTDKSIFLFGLAFGKLNSPKENIFVLSLSAPIGKAFLGRGCGDTVLFNQTTYTIKSIK